MTTTPKTQAGERTQTTEILWDCTTGVYEPAPVEKATITRECAFKNLTTNDEGETFFGEMLEDVARLRRIRGGDDTSVKAEIANNPWLTPEAVIAGLEQSANILERAGFDLDAELSRAAK